MGPECRSRDRCPPATPVAVTIADRQVVLLVQLGREGEPEPAGIEVVILVLDQQFPPGRLLLSPSALMATALMPADVGIDRLHPARGPRGSDTPGDPIAAVRPAARRPR